MAQRQPAVAAQAIGIDKGNARIGFAFAQVQGKAQGCGGFAKPKGPHHKVDALGPLFRPPGLHRHHAAQAFEHGSAGFGQQALIQAHGHGVGNALTLQIFQRHALAGRESLKLNGGLHQGKDLILDLHPILVPFAPARGRAVLGGFGLGALDACGNFVAHRAVFAIGAVAQDNGVGAHLGLYSGQNFLWCGSGERLYLHGPILPWRFNAAYRHPYAVCLTTPVFLQIQGQFGGSFLQEAKTLTVNPGLSSREQYRQAR